MESANPYTPSSQSMPLATQFQANSRSLRIKRIDVFSVAKIMGVLYAILGLIGGLFFGVMALFGAALGGADNGNAVGGVLVGIAAIIFTPIFYGLVGFVAGAIGALFYNLVAGMVGGVIVDVEG